MVALMFVTLFSLNFSSNLTNTFTPILENTSVRLSLENQEDSGLIHGIDFNETDSNILIEMKEEVSSLLIFDSNGSLEFVLPIDAKNVIIGMSLFEKGDYRISFNFKNKELGLTSMSLASL